MKDGFVKIAAGVPEIALGDCMLNAERIISMSHEMSAAGVKLAVFTELGITGYTLEDIFLQQTLLKAAEKALSQIIAETAELDMLIAVGVPVPVGCSLYNCAAFINRGRLLALIPKTHIPMYSEFYEGRRFTPAPENGFSINYAGQNVFLGQGMLRCSGMPELIVAAEICEDAWVPCPPSVGLAQAGANVIFNLSCSNELIGKSEYRRSIIRGLSGSLICAYAYCSAGDGESTTDLVFSGHCMICENASMLAQQRWNTGSFITADIDIQRIDADRRRMTTFTAVPSDKYKIISEFSLDVTETMLERSFSPTPFVPSDKANLEERCREIIHIQSSGLQRRLKGTHSKCAVIGLSGGLDSTLAYLVTVDAFKALGKPLENIAAVTMPCFGTTSRTKSNAQKMAEAIGTSFKEIDIHAAVQQHFSDIGHDGVTTDVTYENSQARIRTLILMNTANKLGGLVIGTGDLSELALGWATYNGDHMSMYGVNAGVPKTLVRYLVGYFASASEEPLKSVLYDVLDTPVSPELLPPEENGEIAQRTEDIVGPYELHDFFMYYIMRFGFPPHKIYRIALRTFEGKYSPEIIKKWLVNFVRRFFTQQFKRSCLPDGPKVGSTAISPRGDWRMPSDMLYAEWMRDAESV